MRPENAHDITKTAIIEALTPVPVDSFGLAVDDFTPMTKDCGI